MTAPARHLRLIDENGEFVPSQKLDELNAALEKAQGDLKAAERDLRVKRRQITELQRDKARERLEHKQYALIERVCKYWWRRNRNGDFRVNPMSPARFDAVAGLVDMQTIVMEEVNGKTVRRRDWRYQMEDFKAAIDGAHFDHYVKKRKNGSEQHFDDLELICRDSKQFEEFRARCPYEVVPLSPARVRPDALAREAGKCENPDRGSNHVRLSQAGNGKQEGSYGATRALGAAGRRAHVPLEGCGIYAPGGVGFGHPGASAT